jgi:hypothetical protein
MNLDNYQIDPNDDPRFHNRYAWAQAKAGFGGHIAEHLEQIEKLYGRDSRRALTAALFYFLSQDDAERAAAMCDEERVRRAENALEAERNGWLAHVCLYFPDAVLMIGKETYRIVPREGRLLADGQEVDVLLSLDQYQLIVTDRTSNEALGAAVAQAIAVEVKRWKDNREFLKANGFNNCSDPIPLSDLWGKILGGELDDDEDDHDEGGRQAA